MQLLDGRREVADRRPPLSRRHSSRGQEQAEAHRAPQHSSVAFGAPVPFEPPDQRFAFVREPAGTTMKVTIINILVAVCNMRANFRLAKLAAFRSTPTTRCCSVS